MRPETRPEPGKHKALALAIVMHGLLAVVLFFGVQWKRSVPDVVEVELWAARPSLPPPPEPVEPTPTPPEPKPIPKIEKPPEPKPLVKPDIVTKVEKKQPPPEPTPKPVPPKAPEPKPTPDFNKMLEQEEKQRKVDAMKAALLAEDSGRAAAANKLGEAAWKSKIVAAIFKNIKWPSTDTVSNPTTEFRVTILENGKIFSIQMKKSSGDRSWDAAAESAISASSPLPLPDNPKVFDRILDPVTLCPNPQPNRGCR